MNRPGDLRAALEPLWALRGDRAHVERLRRVLLDRPHLIEADEAVELLASFPAGLSGSEVARRLHRSKAVVLHALHADPRVEQTRTGRGSRFRLTPRSREPQRTGQEDSSAAPLPSPGLRDTSPLPASEKRSGRAAVEEVA